MLFNWWTISVGTYKEVMYHYETQKDLTGISTFFVVQSSNLSRLDCYHWVPSWMLCFILQGFSESKFKDKYVYQVHVPSWLHSCQCYVSSSLHNLYSLSDWLSLSLVTHSVPEFGRSSHDCGGILSKQIDPASQLVIFSFLNLSSIQNSSVI